MRDGLVLPGGSHGGALGLGALGFPKAVGGLGASGGAVSARSSSRWLVNSCLTGGACPGQLGAIVQEVGKAGGQEKGVGFREVPSDDQVSGFTRKLYVPLLSGGAGGA